MPEIFDMDARELIKLSKFFRRAPKKARSAVSGVLTTMAFQTRRAALKEIHDKMEVRNQSFIVSNIRFDRARGNMPINRQQSETGSIAKPRFTGLAEQQTGQKAKRTRVATQLARGGSQSKQIAPRFRLKSGRDFVETAEYRGRTEQARFAAMLRDLTSRNYKKPFVIRRHRKYKKGLYILKQKKIRKLQEFKSKKAQPKRINWLTDGRDNYLKRADLKAIWGKELERVLRKR